MSKNCISGKEMEKIHKYWGDLTPAQRLAIGNVTKALSMRVVTSKQVNRLIKKNIPSDQKEKKPMTSFAYYVKLKYPKLKETQPEATFREITAQLADKWNQLDEDKKDWYKKNANKSQSSSNNTEIS
jgi:hypothetical protein